MGTQEIAEFYAALDNERKLKFLGLLIFFLSQASRNVYPEVREGSESHISIMKTLNELIHRTSTQQLKLLTPKVQGYPDSAYWEIVFENIKLDDLGRLIIWAITKAQQNLD